MNKAATGNASAGSDITRSPTINSESNSDRDPPSVIQAREGLLTVNPVLVVSHGQVVTLIVATKDTKEPPSDFPLAFRTIGTYEASAEVVAVTWLMGQLLILVTAKT